MMDEFDKSETATPYKLERARSKGSVARSPEFAGAVVVLAAAIAFYARGENTLRDLFVHMRDLWAAPASVSPDMQGLLSLMSHGVAGLLGMFGPYCVLIVVVAALANVVQTGPIWSAFPLKPDLSRINPVDGLRRFFSLRTLYDAAKSVLKVAVLGTVLYYATKSAVRDFFAYAQASPADSLHVLLDVAAKVGLKLAAVGLLLACLDFGYTRFSFARKMRMSRRDVKDEVKQREGDPRIRSRLRGLRIEMLKRAAAQRHVRDSDVLIVNPTHIAVALQYRRGEMTAPVLLAKGAGALAKRMRQTAARHGIPIVENRTLARALYFQTEIQGSIPEALFPEVAKIIVWVLAMRQSRRKAQLRGAVQ